jgi:hypothetical protein
MGISSTIKFRSFAPMKGVGAQDDIVYTFGCELGDWFNRKQKPRT